MSNVIAGVKATPSLIPQCAWQEPSIRHSCERAPGPASTALTRPPAAPSIWPSACVCVSVRSHSSPFLQHQPTLSTAVTHPPPLTILQRHHPSHSHTSHGSDEVTNASCTFTQMSTICKAVPQCSKSHFPGVSAATSVSCRLTHTATPCVTTSRCAANHTSHK